MNFAWTSEQAAIRAAVEDVCKDFDDDYWLRKDSEGGFPEDFYRAMAQAGWLGIAMPVVVVKVLADILHRRTDGGLL